MSVENQPMDGVSSSGIQVIEDILVQPAIVNANDSEGDDGIIHEMRMNHTESEAPYLYGLENGGCIKVNFENINFTIF